MRVISERHGGPAGVLAAVGWPVPAAVLLGVAGTAEVAVRSGSSPAAMLLVLAATAPVALVGLWPLAATGMTVAATVAILAAGLPVPVSAVAALLVALFVTGRRYPPGWAAALVLPLAVTVATGRGVAVLVLAASAALAGVGVRARVRSLDRAAADRAREDTLLDYVARGERARIARELHDVVAHHISMVALQADAARLTITGMPADGAAALASISDTARSALAEMRRLLGVLRTDADNAAGPDRRPQPGLRQLTELLDEARQASGASTRLIVSGAVRPLDPGIELTAYRIVQEALTNARRHAPGAAVDVHLDYADDKLRIRVRDSGPGPAPVTAGHGLAGMRERAEMAGGHVSTGPGPVGGFLVEASLPAAYR